MNLDYKRTKLVIYSVIIPLLIIFIIYPFFHEMGHGIMATVFGAKIQKIVLGANARINYNFGDIIISDAKTAIINVSGALLPYILWLILILIYRKSQNVIYLLGIGFYSLITISSLGAWVIMPVLYAFGKAPTGDDVTKFLNNSNIHYISVSIVAVLLIIISIYIVLKKDIIKTYKKMILDCK